MAAKMERTAYPGIYKRGGRYVIKWRDRGVQRKESFRTLAEAREAKGRRQAGETRVYSRQRFDEYATEWLRTYQGRTGAGLADSSRDSYRRAIEQAAIPFFGRMKLGDIEPPDLRAFVKWMQDRGVRAPTVRKNLASVKTLLQTAYEDGAIKTNPGQGMRLMLGSDSHGKARAMTREDLRVVLAAVPDPWRPLFTFLAQTGLRISEALAVTWADLELGKHPHVKVRRQFYKGQLKELKTRHSRRDVPLSPAMVQTLLAMRARGYAEDRPVFCSRNGGHLDRHNLRRRVLRPALKPMGMEWVGFHTFRHTCASLLLADGGKAIKQVQGWLGHADPGFTLRTYVHLMDEGLGSADFMDHVVGGTRVAPQQPQTAANAASAI